MTATDSEQPGQVPENGQSAGDESFEALLAAAEARAEQHRADFLRAIAELENYRKRSAREVDSARQFGIERLAADLLPVADTLGLAVEAAATADAETLAQGQEATLRLLMKAFERAGLVLADPAGEPFDPSVHEAMAVQPAEGQAPGTVLQVVQTGWILNGRVLRPARVIVAAETPGAEAPSGG